MSSVSEFIAQHPIITIIIGLVLLLLLFLVVVPSIFKLIGLRKKTKETVSLKQDLMIWHRLSGLARGGKSADAAKASLAKGQIALLRESFKKVYSMLKKNNKGKYDIPWYISVGEPSSGKSTLMSVSDLDMVVSESENMVGEQKSLPMRFWLGGQALVVDVSGKAFFDRWFEGSSAEWNEIVKLLRSKHSKRPLSGIILTIPADALIADDDEISKRKALLIATELHRLVSMLSMRLPCHVVITKMDVVTGFREYFSQLDETMRRKVFGWVNDNHNAGYDKQAFSNFWENTLEQLRSGRNFMMLSKSVVDTSDENTNRLDTSGGIYMFPEAFNSLYANLDKYLKTVFGMRNAHGLEELMLDGVYFTSRKDEGITFNSGFANLKGKSIDDAPMTGGAKTNKSFFITNLLCHRIFPESWVAEFTRIGKFKRSIPYYMTTAGITALAAIWIFAGLFEKNQLRKLLNTQTSHYETMAVLFEKDAISKSPLISSDESGTPQNLFNLPMAYNSSIKRLEFYTKAHADAFISLRAPFGFGVSSLFKYRTTDIAFRERQLIFSRIQSNMSFLPTVFAVLDNFNHSVDEPMDIAKRDALFQMLKLSVTFKSTNESHRETNYEPETMASFLQYLFPTMVTDVKKLLSSYNSKYDEDRGIRKAEIILNEKYLTGTKAGINAVLNGWINLTNYPDALFNLQKDLILRTDEMGKLIADYKNITLAEPDIYDIMSIKSGINDWLSLYEKEKKIGEEINNALRHIDYHFANTKNPVLATAIKNANIDLIFSIAYANYEQMLKDDFASLVEYDRSLSDIENIYATHISRLIDAQLKDVKDNALKKLKAEYDHLKSNILSTENSPLLENVASVGDNETASEEAPNYMVFHDMIRLSVVPNIYSAESKILEPISEWELYENNAALQMESLDELLIKYKDTLYVESFGALSKEILNRQNLYNKLQFIRNTLNLYPTSATGIMIKASQLELTPDMEYILTKGKSEPRKIKFQAEYNPLAADMYIKPFGMLRNLINIKNEDGSDTYTSQYFGKDARYLATSRMMNEYTDNFIKYWGGLGDSLSPNVSNYTSFHSFVSSNKAYDINSKLYAVYDISHSIIFDIGDELLTPSALGEKNNAIALIDTRRNNLTIQFSDMCTKLLAAWASLPRSAVDANKVVMGMPETRLRGELLTLSGEDAGSIPWWSSLISKGTRLIKVDASSVVANNIKNYQVSFSKFPLLADGDPTNGIHREEMWSLLRILNDFGWSVSEADKEGVPQEGESLAIKEPLKLKGIVNNEEAVKEWGTKTVAILNVLVGGAKPLEWTLVIPDMAVQLKLAESFIGAHPAVARFRYAESTVSSIKYSGRYPTSAGQGKELTPMKADGTAPDLTFDFFTHSGSTTPEATVSINGAWSVLSLYLKDEVVKDSEKNIYYVPLTMSDGMGVEYVFFVGIKFNKTLPEPEDWPSSYNWPSFSYFYNAPAKDVKHTFNGSLFDTAPYYAGY